METFTSILKRFNSELWYFYIQVPEEAARPILNIGTRRVICTLNDTEHIHCALMPNGKGGFFINLNKEIRKKLALEVGDELKVNLRKDESKYGLPIAEEFEALLKLDDEGSAFFHALTPGKQRSLIHIVSKPKSSDVRLRKALAVVDYLKSTAGKLDFKELNEALKLRHD